ncbi:hypothetical protein KVT40_003269 [Elsinoe batatas]|uniref:Uncharacterized protein n=1 Tax=Elsinoe batatas TaxID=2601811 RepID=A0A8K0L481_9PEZI|nr:hypothetical protein KVT40_003269 [Elsinoe batatas]
MASQSRGSVHMAILPRRLSTVLVCHGGLFQKDWKSLSKSITTSPISPSTAWHHHPPKRSSQNGISRPQKRGFVHGLRLEPAYHAATLDGQFCRNVLWWRLPERHFLTTVVVGWRCGRNGQMDHLPFLMGWGG